MYKQERGGKYVCAIYRYLQCFTLCGDLQIQNSEQYLDGTIDWIIHYRYLRIGTIRSNPNCNNCENVAEFIEIII